ncbi:MAG: hypothetical protein AAF809_07330 [Bacteroidota bacterium]
MSLVPPIRLLDHYAEHIAFDVLQQPESRPEKGIVFDNLGIDIAYDDPVPVDDDGAALERIAFRMTVRVNDANDTPAAVAYRAVIGLRGLFERQSLSDLADPPPEETYLMHTVASAVASLYGAARELLIVLSGPAPFGKVLLPSISPAHAAQQMLRKQSAPPPGDVDEP